LVTNSFGENCHCQCLSKEQQHTYVPLVHVCTYVPFTITKPSWRQPHEALISILDHSLHTTHNSLCLHATLSLMRCTVDSRIYSRMYRMIKQTVPAYIRAYVASRSDGKGPWHSGHEVCKQYYMSLGDHKFALFHVGEWSALQWERMVCGCRM